VPFQSSERIQIFVAKPPTVKAQVTYFLRSTRSVHQWLSSPNHLAKSEYNKSLLNLGFQQIISRKLPTTTTTYITSKAQKE
jgi:hypothetical protein